MRLVTAAIISSAILATAMALPAPMTTQEIEDAMGNIDDSPFDMDPFGNGSQRDERDEEDEPADSLFDIDPLGSGREREEPEGSPSENPFDPPLDRPVDYPPETTPEPVDPRYPPPRQPENPEQPYQPAPGTTETPCDGSSSVPPPSDVTPPSTEPPSQDPPYDGSGSPYLPPTSTGYPQPRDQPGGTGVPPQDQTEYPGGGDYDGDGDCDDPEDGIGAPYEPAAGQGYDSGSGNEVEDLLAKSGATTFGVSSAAALLSFAVGLLVLC